MKYSGVMAAAIGFFLLFAGCSNPMAIDEAHGIGKATVYIEESYRPLFDTSIYTFEGQNPLADITAVYETEEAVIKAFMEKKTETICITRDFTEAEKAKLMKSLIQVKSEMIAKDAVVIYGCGIRDLQTR